MSKLGFVGVVEADGLVEGLCSLRLGDGAEVREEARHNVIEVSSVQDPGGRSKFELYRRPVTGGKEWRGRNSTGPPRASVVARPRREPRMREERVGDGGGGGGIVVHGEGGEEGREIENEGKVVYCKCGEQGGAKRWFV